MKKIKKLALNRQTVAILSGRQLRIAAGGQLVDIITVIDTQQDEMCGTGGTGGTGGSVGCGSGYTCETSPGCPTYWPDPP